MGKIVLTFAVAPIVIPLLLIAAAVAVTFAFIVIVIQCLLVTCGVALAVAGFGEPTSEPKPEIPTGRPYGYG